MSAALSLIVYGQVFLLGPAANVRPIVIGSHDSTAIPAIDRTLDKTKPFEENTNSQLIPAINRRLGEIELSEKIVKRGDYTKICESEGAHLAIVNSAKEAQVIGDLFAKSGHHLNSQDSNYAHIGFHDLYEEGEFVTIDGKSLATVGYYEWQSGNPNNDGNNENCGSVYRNGQLNDITCAKSVAFVCELPDPAHLEVGMRNSTPAEVSVGVRT
ncbi:hemolymph lipopolysaccharide-binding protein-like [Diprion similis]|uniref:hemolymph lipopolysaccharide-binding protein-like n=1 Tax=Diprion similis TaxID=362088 RepID=UPI001EF7A16D|nr:hemolymph lipopolysaccharide-binding protein-like [Diprion similis]